MNTDKNSTKALKENVFNLEGRVPFINAFPIGLQHVLTMFVANVTTMIIFAASCGLPQELTAKLIQNAMIVAGVGSLLQLFPVWRIGSGLPIVMGISISFLNASVFIGTHYGVGFVIGSIIIGGIVEGVLGLFAKYWMKRISHIVSASVVMAIGLSLIPVGAKTFGGGVGVPAEKFGQMANWIAGGVSLLTCLIFGILAKGYLKTLSVLAGLTLGYIVSIPLGLVDFSILKNVEIVALPKFLPFKPEFNISAIITMVVIFMVSATETIGDTSAVAESGLKRKASEKEIAGSLAVDGFVSSIAALFGCLPVTSFSENVGLVAMTKVVNRFTIAIGACIMIIAGFFPLFGNFLTTIPASVLGGCSIMMFGSIAVVGLRMVADSGYNHRNEIICALSLGVGMGFSQCEGIYKIFPQIFQNIFAGNCIASVFVIALILDWLLPKEC